MDHEVRLHRRPGQHAEGDLRHPRRVAQGVNAAVVFPDAGKAVLPAITQAYKAGVVTVPLPGVPGGKAGVDYNAYISTQFAQAGALWGNWLDKALHCKGNVINLGGPPANTQSLAEYQGLKKAIAYCPDIHIIGQTPYYVTNWDPAQTQKVVTAVLAKYPDIDAITTDFGSALASSSGVHRRPGARSRRSPPRTPTSSRVSRRSSSFQLFTVDSQNWMVRTRSTSRWPRRPAARCRPPRSSRRRRSRIRSPASRTPSSATVDAQRRDPLLAPHPQGAAQGGAGRVGFKQRRSGRRGPTRGWRRVNVAPAHDRHAHRDHSTDDLARCSSCADV